MSVAIAVGNSVHGSFGLRGHVLLSCLDERLENGIRIVEVIVHDVDEERGIHEVGYQLSGRCVRIVHLRPLLPEFESLVLISMLVSIKGKGSKQHPLSTP